MVAHIAATVITSRPRTSTCTHADHRAPSAVAIRSVNSETESESVGYPSNSEKRWIIEISTTMNPNPSAAK